MHLGNKRRGSGCTGGSIIEHRRHLQLSGLHACTKKLTGARGLSSEIPKQASAAPQRFVVVMNCLAPQSVPASCNSLSLQTRCWSGQAFPHRHFAWHHAKRCSTSKAPVRSSGGPPTLCSRMLLAVRSECSSPCSRNHEAGFKCLASLRFVHLVMQCTLVQQIVAALPGNARPCVQEQISRQQHDALLFTWIKYVEDAHPCVQVVHGGRNLRGDFQDALHVGGALEDVAALPKAALINGRLQALDNRLDNCTG